MRKSEELTDSMKIFKMGSMERPASLKPGSKSCYKPEWFYTRQWRSGVIAPGDALTSRHLLL